MARTHAPKETHTHTHTHTNAATQENKPWDTAGGGIPRRFSTLIGLEFLQPVSCHNTYLPGEKLHLKDLPKRNHRTAHGCPGTMKRKRKNEIDTEREGVRGVVGSRKQEQKWQSETKTAWEAVQRRCTRTPGDGQTQCHHNFHFSVCSPR